MDFSQGLTGFIPNWTQAQILNGILITTLVIGGLGGLGVFLYWFIKKKKYNQFKIVIWEKDSTGNTHEYYDKGGVFLDKATGFKLLFLEKMKTGLNPNNIPYVTSKDKKGKLVKTVYLRRTGVSNFVFCHVKIGDDGVLFTVGEEDANWMQQEMEKIRRTFGNESWLQKFAPYIMFIITIMIVMIILISLFNKFEVLKTVSDNMLKISQEQGEITRLMYNMTQTPNSINKLPIIVAGGKT